MNGGNTHTEESMSQVTRTFRGPDARSALQAVKASHPPAGVAAHEPKVTLPPPLPTAPARDIATQEELERLREALESMRVEVRNMSRPAEHRPVAPEAAELLARFGQRGVEKTIAQEMVHQALSRSHELSGIREAVEEAINERLVTGRAPWMKDHRKAIALVGPTGVGKTTTLAKIAARAVMESKLKVSISQKPPGMMRQPLSVRAA